MSYEGRQYTGTTGRQLIYVELRKKLDTELINMLSNNWIVHKARDVQAIQKLVEDNNYLVGVARFDGNCLALCRPELKDILFSTPHLKWVAVLPHATMENDKVRAMISWNFHDYHYLPVDSRQLNMTLGHAYGKVQLERQACDDVSRRKHVGSDDGLVGNSIAIKALRRQAEKIARVDTPALLTGESGTGKELVANLIHRASRRAAGPFVAVNCASLSLNLIQSELFGHEKGAFTGAHKKKIGRFEAADGGTIFLDEIGDLPPEMQIMLLRVLEQRTIERVGGLLSIPVDLRVIAATNVDLEQAIEQGRFREDLYFRLKVLHLRMPSLCERGQDLEVLANYFLDKFSVDATANIRGLSQSAIRTMYSHSWPGNVRELMNCIRGALVMSEGPLLMPDDLGLERRTMRRTVRTLEEARAMAERAAILNAFERTGSNITQSSEYLGISRGTLYRLMQKYKVKWPMRRGRDEPLTAEKEKDTRLRHH